MENFYYKKTARLFPEQKLLLFISSSYSWLLKKFSAKIFWPPLFTLNLLASVLPLVPLILHWCNHQKHFFFLSIKYEETFDQLKGIFDRCDHTKRRSRYASFQVYGSWVRVTTFFPICFTKSNLRNVVLLAACCNLSKLRVCVCVCVVCEVCVCVRVCVAFCKISRTEL